MKLLRVEEIAKILSFSPKKIRNMCAAGEIPSVKIAGEYRVEESELENYVKTMTVTA